MTTMMTIQEMIPWPSDPTNTDAIKEVVAVAEVVAEAIITIAEVLKTMTRLVASSSTSSRWTRMVIMSRADASSSAISPSRRNGSI